MFYAPEHASMRARARGVRACVRVRAVEGANTLGPAEIQHLELCQVVADCHKRPHESGGGEARGQGVGKGRVKAGSCEPYAAAQVSAWCPTRRVCVHADVARAHRASRQVRIVYTQGQRQMVCMYVCLSVCSWH